MKSFALAVLVPVLAVAGEAPQPGQAEAAGRGGMMGGMMNDGMGGMMGGSMKETRIIHGLLSNHTQIQRSAEDIPNGVRTVTTSKDPEVTSLIREHVWQMKERIEQGRPIRQMDALFREVFKNHQHIHIAIENVEGGVRVTETSDSPRSRPSSASTRVERSQSSWPRGCRA